MAEIIEENVLEVVKARVEVEENKPDLMLEDIEAIVPFDIFETNESIATIQTIDQVVLIEENEIKKEISFIEISSSSSSGGEEFEVDSVVVQRQGKTEIEYLIHFKGILGLYLNLFKIFFFVKVIRMNMINGLVLKKRIVSLKYAVF
jgi:hypothetical protein